MGSLVNGRRVGRTPFLLAGVVVACILGLNYWISNSRNVELQAKVLELEGKVYDAAMERAGAQQVEEQRRSEAEERVRRQGDLITRMEDSFKRQQERDQAAWSLERETLQQNISSSVKAVEDMKNQLKILFEDLGKVQKELQSCQSNLNTMTKKLPLDLHNTQMLTEEGCAEKVAKAKLELEKKYGKEPLPVASKMVFDSTQKLFIPDAGGSEKFPLNDSSKISGEAKRAEPSTELQPKPDHDSLKLMEIDNNEIVGAEGPAKDQETLKTLPSPKSTKPLILKQPNEMRILPANGDNQGILPEDPLMDEDVIVDGRQDEYITDDEADDEEEKGKGIMEKDLEEEMADYNGDDENEPEFEADKQAELAEV